MQTCSLWAATKPSLGQSATWRRRGPGFTGARPWRRASEALGPRRSIFHPAHGSAWSAATPPGETPWRPAALRAEGEKAGMLAKRTSHYLAPSSEDLASAQTALPQDRTALASDGERSEPQSRLPIRGAVEHRI